jgi:hypothetical protein
MWHTCAGGACLGCVSARWQLESSHHAVLRPMQSMWVPLCGLSRSATPGESAFLEKPCLWGRTGGAPRNHPDTASGRPAKLRHKTPSVSAHYIFGPAALHTLYGVEIQESNLTRVIHTAKPPDFQVRSPEAHHGSRKNRFETASRHNDRQRICPA